VKRVLSRASSNLIPVLGYVQVSGDHTMPLIPYAGAGVGYEAYFLSADDFNTGAHFDAEYGASPGRRGRAPRCRSRDAAGSWARCS